MELILTPFSVASLLHQVKLFSKLYCHYIKHFIERVIKINFFSLSMVWSQIVWIVKLQRFQSCELNYDSHPRSIWLNFITWVKQEIKRTQPSNLLSLILLNEDLFHMFLDTLSPNYSRQVDCRRKTGKRNDELEALLQNMKSSGHSNGFI